MSKFKVFAKYIFKDCYKKFLTDYIIFDDGLEDTIKNNSLPISQMTEEQKIKLLDSLEIYSNYNEDFSRIIKKKDFKSKCYSKYRIYKRRYEY